MPILENMTLSEKHNYARLKKRGYSDEEAKDMLLAIRAIPQEERKELERMLVENMKANFRRKE